MGEEIKLSQWVNELIVAILAEGEEWLSDTFKKCLNVKEARKQLPDYGFEWAIQTLFADALLRRRSEFDISNLRINQPIQEYGNAKPDLAFDKGIDLVILELKAVAKRSLSWTAGDVPKKYPDGTAVFFLTVSYPADGSWSKELTGATFVAEGGLPNGFSYSLFRKSDVSLKNADKINSALSDKCDQ